MSCSRSRLLNPASVLGTYYPFLRSCTWKLLSFASFLYFLTNFLLSFINYETYICKANTPLNHKRTWHRYLISLLHRYVIINIRGGQPQMLFRSKAEGALEGFRPMIFQDAIFHYHQSPKSWFRRTSSHNKSGPHLPASHNLERIYYFPGHTTQLCPFQFRLIVPYGAQISHMLHSHYGS